MISEADWKHFKQVKADALDKCCQQVLDDVRKGIDDPELSNHAKYIMNLLKTNCELLEY